MTTNSTHYHQRMDRVAERIANALRDGDTPTLKDMAAAAALSPFHFHRVYRILTGETAGDTIRRLRLARALALVEGGESITEAAHAAGYGSSQSLAKAVKQRVGASITKLRSDDRISDEIRRMQVNQGGNAMTFELVDHSPVRIACRLVTGPYSRLNLAFRSLFDDFCLVAKADEIRGVYGIPVDDPRHAPESEHRFISALGVSERVLDIGDANSNGIGLRGLGGGRYALARHFGSYAEVPAAIDAVYAALISAGHELRDRETFLHYVDQPDAPEGDDVVHESHIYVPVAD